MKNINIVATMVVLSILLNGCICLDSSILKRINKVYEFTYIADKTDYWQTPIETEIRKGGDCEDQALWLYYELKQLKYDVVFVVGKIYKTSEMYHAWLELNFNEKTYILDPISNRPISIKRFENMYINIPNLSCDIKFQDWKFRLNFK